jgi:type IV pilus assembly protein PilC
MAIFIATYLTNRGQSRQLELQASDLPAAKGELRRRGIKAIKVEPLLAGSQRKPLNAALTATAGLAPTRLASSSNSMATAGVPTAGVPTAAIRNTIKPDNSRKWYQLSILEFKPGIREMALFANKLFALVTAGVPIVRSLSLLAKQQRHPLFKRALEGIIREVNQGSNLSTAMRRWPKVFDKLSIAMVDAGESGGILDESLQRLAKLLEQHTKLQNEIKAAMGYPSIVLAIAILVFLGLTIFLIPVYANIFETLNAELPPLTLFLVNLSSILRTWFPIIFGIIIACLWLFSRYYSTKSGKLLVDSYLLKLPLFGELLQKSATAKFCRTFSSLSRAGVPILRSLEIVSETTGNAKISKAIWDSRQEVMEGIPLSASLERHRVFPELALSMLAIGEETGRVEMIITKMADFYEDEVSAIVRALTSMLEPALIVIVGGIVAVILLAMYLPMFAIYDNIK